MSPAPIKPLIDLTVLDSIDVRVGRIESVSGIDGSDKLVQLKVNFGDHRRTIVAALKSERRIPGKSKASRLCSLSTWLRARCGCPV